MTSLYSEEHRRLQQEFGTTPLADLLDNNWVHEKIADAERDFIGSRDMFFLSTVDPDGNPTVSYKGGPVGLVKVIDEQTLAFPGFDGNGMFYSMGNIAGQAKVGLLFIDFESPHRVRVQGTARFLREHPVMAEYAEAQYLVLVTVSKIWVNCPRYIHKYKRVDSSKYVPQPSRTTPLASWKRLGMVQDVLGAGDRQRAEQEGLIELSDYEQRVARGDA
ncbi:MAG: pyridoxamine 5'-phosphate oxidase family protein [Pseudomonadota bacterium]|nr:pyridoxamine 5'-phosphate oxidase family protein [Pseudomonadota bacterium]